MSGQDWPVGTVATATVRGVEGVRVMRTRILDGWIDADGYGHTPEGKGLCTSEPVTDVRPLVVLDLDETIGKSLLPHWLRNSIRKIEEGCVSPSSIGKDMAWLADQIEAQTKPPRIPEPGLWGVVEAHTAGDSERRRFGRTEAVGTAVWIDAFGWHCWSSLIDPILVRPGIEDAP